MEKKIIKRSWPGSTQLYPLPVVLVGCGGKNGWKNNLITIAWTGIVCSKPPMLTVSVRPERYSYKMIKENGEFTVNLPPVSLAEATDWCGVRSGRDFDKFKEQHLTPFTGSCTAAPMVMECPVNLECVVKSSALLGTHEMFLAEIVQVHVSEEYIDGDGKFDIAKVPVLGYSHGSYCEMKPPFAPFGFSVKKQ